LAVGLVVMGLLAAAIGLLPTEDLVNFFLHGQEASDEGVAPTLTGRIRWWEASIPVWQESPLIGKGLLTATRFEVLSVIGRVSGSNVHSTWVETLVGTGILGSLFIVSCLAICCWRALNRGLRDRNEILPILILAVMGVRSLTGTSFEAFSLWAMVLLLLALVLEDGNPLVPSWSREA
ncbi:MAG: O-antigen ligase family protein, partial [Actinomycetota bacterium]